MRPLQGGGDGGSGDKTSFLQEWCPETLVGHQTPFPRQNLGTALGYKGHLGQLLERGLWRFHGRVGVWTFGVSGLVGLDGGGRRGCACGLGI